MTDQKTAAGFSRQCITPPVGTILSGFIERDRDHGCTSIHDDLYVRALWLQQAQATVLILSYDLLFFTRALADRLKGMLANIVPLLPGTVFLLMAAFFFFRSNERMYNWVLNDPRFGPLIRNYRAGNGIPRRIKVLAIGLIIASFGVSVVLVVDGFVPRAILIACAVAVSTFILTRPTTEVVLGSD